METTTNQTATPAISADEAILALLIQGNPDVTAPARDLKPIDFMNERHQTIFQTYVALQADLVCVDSITMCHRLEQSCQLSEVGGKAFIDRLAGLSANAVNAQGYVDCIRAASIKRQRLIAVAGVGAAIKSGGDIAAANQLLAASMVSSSSAGAHVRSMLSDFKASLKTRIKGVLTGVPAGIDDLDAMTNGFQPGNLVIIAARPSMGKTALALNIANHAGLQKGSFPTIIYSLEMSSKELMERLVASNGKIWLERIRKGDIGDKYSVERMIKAFDIIDGSDLYIDDTAALDLFELCSRIRRRVAEDGIRLVVIDYLQLIRVNTGGKYTDRQSEVALISSSLKALAKELEIPIIALSQLNRELEKRGDKRPMMSDLRESGAIEQDADIVLFLYRDAVYCDECKTERTTGNPCTKGHSNDAEIIIGKFRNGVVDHIGIEFDGTTQRFLNKGTMADEAEKLAAEQAKHQRAPHPAEVKPEPEPPFIQQTLPGDACRAGETFNADIG